MISWAGSDYGLNRYEKAGLSLRTGTRRFRSSVAGVSRIVRLSSVQENEHLQCVWDTGANVAGPMIFFFVRWVLEKAQQQGIKRLYFLARDGQILLKVADIIKERWRYDVECKYLYVSRQALFCPAIENIGEFELFWMTMRDWHKFISVDEVCRRTNIKPADLKESLYRYGFPETAWGKNLCPDELRRLRRCLKDPLVQDIIIDKTGACFKNASGYLNKEGLSEDGYSAIVDLGWSARIQFAMSKIINKAGLRPQGGFTGFYLGLGITRKIYKNDRVSCFLFDWPVTVKKFLAFNIFNQTVYEIFTCADHGRTIAYAEKSGSFWPVLDSQVNGYNIDWGCLIQQESIIKFADIFTMQFGRETVEEDTARAILDDILYRFMQQPSIKEAAAYGRYDFRSEIMEDISWEVAPLIDRKKLWLVDIITKKYVIFWPSGSLVRSKMPFLRRTWVVFQAIFLLSLRSISFAKRILGRK